MTIKSRFHNIVNHLSLAVIVIFPIFLLIMTLSAVAVSVDGPALLKLISQNEDSQMSARDLAFFLITHDFDAAPHEDYVEVKIRRSVYELVPNGRYAGLANITEIQ